jgi:site-specific recombinase XerD
MMESLIEQMRMDMVVRDYSPRTIESYLWHLNAFSNHFNHDVANLESDDIRRYLYYLKTEKNYSTSNLRLAYSAIRYLYRNHFEMPIKLKDLRGPKISLRLPVVLSKEEIKRIFDAISNEKHKLIFMIIYSGGLRVSEAANLRIDDIDSHQMRIRVRQGKGRKDRYTLLSEGVLASLREYWKHSRPTTWLFPNRSDKNKPLSTSTIQNLFKASCMKAGIQKQASVHTLRHSFATHLLDEGANLFTIQKLLGHRNIQNTLIYLHLQQNFTRQIKSPIAELLED